MRLERGLGYFSSSSRTNYLRHWVWRSPCGTWRQWRRRIFFWIPPCWRRPEPMAWPVGLRSDPLFSRAVNYGAPCPIIFRPFPPPNAHRKPRHCSPPVLRLAADLATEQLREQGGQGAKFHPTQPPVGPVGSWDGLGVVQGVQLGHRATWFGGGRARPAPAPAPLPPPRTSGWRLAGKAVRLFGS